MLKHWFAPNSRLQELAETYFDGEFYENVESHQLAPGRLGGKTLGLLLAWKILVRELPAEVLTSIHIPQSFFIGSDEFAEVVARCGLTEPPLWKKGGDHVEKQLATANLSKDLMSRLRTMLDEIGDHPVIVRSSSVLEDQYGSSFAGIYRSVFCANSGDMGEKLLKMEIAIKQVYASAFSDDALAYREQKGWSQVPEEMAVLVQVVEGQVNEGLYFPTAAGIAFSENPYCWTERLNPEDGFLRLVWGLGSQAVRPMPGEYPRLLGLTNPQLRPENTTKELYHYSQHQFDTVDLQTGSFVTLPVSQHLKNTYPALRFVASILDEGGLHRVKARVDSRDQLVVTFDQMIEQTEFIKIIDHCLKTLARKMGGLINIEFSVNVISNGAVDIGMLQCRQLDWDRTIMESPDEIPEEKIILRTSRFLFSGGKQDIEYVVFIEPDIYLEKLSTSEQQDLARLIDRINEQMGEDGFLMVGPGRWGSIRPDLGVPVRFADIYNAKSLVEIHSSAEDLFSATYGTHFFLDLVEAKIALLAIDINEMDGFTGWKFLKEANNVTKDFIQGFSISHKAIKVLRVHPDQSINIGVSPGKRMAFVYWKV